MNKVKVLLKQVKDSPNTLAMNSKAFNSRTGVREYR
jgi:hypothetical protein